MPELSDDAMENWGLVTFRSMALLVNPATTDLDTTTRAAYIIAHELAHQWFGNLVTMSWWNDLWLNEGFATWAGWAACDHFFPDWDVWGQFLVDDMQEALDLDTLASSHPVQVPVPDGLEVDSIFDDISYLKGAAIVRMLAGVIGEKAFLQGVASYLQSNAYGNCTANDLWRHLSEASGQDVTSLMNPWVNHQGYPLINVTESSSVGKIVVSQEGKDFLWPTPLHAQTSTGIRNDILRGQPIVYEDSARINVDEVGFFRTRLSKSYLEKLIADPGKLSPHSQAGILCNAIALAWTGAGSSTTDVLALLDRFSGSSNAIVWDAISSVLSRLQSIFGDDEDIADYLDDFTRELAEPVFNRIGHSFQKEDDHNTNRLRVQLFELVGLSGNETTVATVRKSTRRWLKGNQNAIHPYISLPTLEIAIVYMGDEVIDPLWNVFTKSNDPVLRDRIACAFGCIQKRKSALNSLERAFNGDMATQDIQALMMTMADDANGRETLWTFLVDNWEKVKEKVGGSMAIFNPLIGETLRCFATDEAKTKIVKFFEEKDTTGYTRGLTVAIDFVEANAKYRKRDVEAVRLWLKKRVGENDWNENLP